MPEGPSLVLVREATHQFEHHRVMEASGNAPIDVSRLEGKSVRALKTWGKHFLICFPDFYVRVHFLMIGSYSVNERHKAKVRLGLKFTNGELFFYASQVRLFEGKPEDSYDWRSDILSEQWDAKSALKKIRAKPEAQIGDILLDQDIVSGSGNIIRNEALYRAKVHPESVISEIPGAKLREILRHVVGFANDFLNWKRRQDLDRHLAVYGKKEDGKGRKLEVEITGKARRKTYVDVRVQKLYIP